uniref:Reverse transcriptase/retrotransposon-derived protein RNase H-like domain-containing protein n=1 Tax=Nicotiana tabacum TaxID=4097 RepID=A0A1S3YFJ7_TOBAC|nr:PREDICTED: uncharacterized protein LOC107775560 [Nicotiana tabacum]
MAGNAEHAVIEAARLILANMTQVEVSTNDLLKKLLLDNQQLRTNFRNLEHQIGQLASAQNTRPVGALPINIEANPKASLNVVSLRNGKQLEEVQSKKRKQVTCNERPATIESSLEKSNESKKPVGEAVVEKPPQLVARPPTMFPQRLHKIKDNAAYKKFLDILKQVQINIPLVDILQEVPKYAKYIKDIVANKRRLTEFETVALTKECSSRIQNKLPQKLKDPGSFTVQISIGKHAVGRAFCDLGASINLMPLSVFRQLRLGEPHPITVILQLVDRFLAHPEATGRAIIDVCKGKMTKRVGDRVEVFNVYKALRLPAHYEELSMISVVESDAPSLVPYMNHVDPVEQVLIGDEEDSEGEMMGEIEKFEELDRLVTLTPPKLSIEEAPKLELNPLPAHLRYAYLGNSGTFPVIISSSLTNTQEEKLLRVLREHKKSIGWTIADIKGISRSVCIHKIFLEDGHRPTVEQQRRLNTVMKEVVKKEVIKLLDAGIIFPISDSNWAGIVLGHKVSRSGIEVDKEKVEAVEKLPPPILVKGVWSFLEHAGFYRLLEKDITFNFDDACLKAFEELKKKLMSAPIIVAPDCSLSFELICDASDHAIEAVLGQRKDKVFYSIYYASKTLDDAQLNYTTTKKELLAVVWAFEKFLAYLEFDAKIRDRKGTENQVVDYLSRLENHDHVEERGQIKEVFPDEQLFAITQDPPPWYADYVNYLLSGVLPPEIEFEARKRFLLDVNFYYWDEPYLYKQCVDQLMRRCIPENEVKLVLYDCHASPYGGHHGGDRTAAKVL